MRFFLTPCQATPIFGPPVASVRPLPLLIIGPSLTYIPELVSFLDIHLLPMATSFLIYKLNTHLCQWMVFSWKYFSLCSFWSKSTRARDFTCLAKSNCFHWYAYPSFFYVCLFHTSASTSHHFTCARHPLGYLQDYHCQLAMLFHKVRYTFLSFFLHIILSLISFLP